MLAALNAKQAEGRGNGEKKLEKLERVDSTRGDLSVVDIEEGEGNEELAELMNKPMALMLHSA